MSEGERVRRIVVCVDDAGWSADNDAVLLGHLQRGEVSAVSVLIDGPTAADWASVTIPQQGSLGLHLSLTWSPREGSRGLGGLLLRSHVRMLSKPALAERILGQLMAFERILGRPPDFVDGHQHVHAFPMIADTLLSILAQRYGAARPPVRSIRSLVWRGWKADLLNYLGGHALSTKLAAAEWPCNRDFAGVYAFDDAQRYQQRMRAWLRQLKDGGLIMCHPGCSGLPEHGAAREAESAYLGSSEWLEDRREAAIELQPFNQSARLHPA